MRLILAAAITAISAATAAAYTQTTVKLKAPDSVIETYSADGLLLAGGQATTIIGPLKVTCNSTSGCTVEDEITVQIGASNEDSNSFGICVTVDGAPFNSGGCFNVLAVLGTHGNFQEVSWRDSVHVKKGKHTLQTQVIVTSNAELGWVQNDFSMYLE